MCTRHAPIRTYTRTRAGIYTSVRPDIEPATNSAKGYRVTRSFDFATDSNACAGSSSKRDTLLSVFCLCAARRFYAPARPAGCQFPLKHSALAARAVSGKKWRKIARCESSDATRNFAIRYSRTVERRDSRAKSRWRRVTYEKRK